MGSIRSVSRLGNIRYKNEKGDLHKEDGHAFEDIDGQKSWLINGKYHREDGPAVVFSDGVGWYFLNGIEYSLPEWERERLKWLDHRGFPMSANKRYNDE